MALNKLNFPATPFLMGDSRPISAEWVQWLMAPRVNTIHFATALGPDSGGTGSTTIPLAGQILVGTGAGIFGVATLLPASAMPALTGDVTSAAGTVATTVVNVDAGAISGILGVPHGGTGLSAGTSGGILGFTATGTLQSSAVLPAHALVLGGGAGATPAALASTGTANTVLHGNAAGDPSFSAVDLAADVTGILPVGNGGTGLATVPANGQVDIGNGTGFTRTMLTAGSGVSIVNAAGSITISATGTGGTVTNVSVVSANGLAGTVANPTSTPSITLRTTVTGILQGDGTAISAASTTGSGSVVLATSPALVTPSLGRATGISLEVSTGTGAYNGLNVRFNGSNAPLGFGVANANGFAYLANNTVQVSASDNQTYDTSTFATRLRMDSGKFTFEYAASGTAGNTITWTTALTLETTGLVTAAKGFTADAGGLKHKRVTTGSVAAGSTALVTVTWGTAFADANYTVQASVLDSTTTSLSLSVVHVESISASAVTVRVLNNAISAITGTLHVIAIHD